MRLKIFKFLLGKIDDDVALELLRAIVESKYNKTDARALSGLIKALKA